MPDELATLLAHADWLRNLARMLVGPSASDDAVQDTYVAALRSPPDPALPPRPWLARVLRNATRMTHRRSTRRARREDAAVAISTTAPAVDDAVARAETFRTLVELVLALDEPYRATLVRHYFDGDTFTEIARRDGVPEATVRGRHRQALARLRAQLDARSHGDRRAWLAALAPIAAPAHTTSITAGVLVVNKILVAAVLVVVTGGAWWWLHPKAAATATSAPPVAATSGVQQAGAALAPRSVDAAAQTPHVRQLASAERQHLADRGGTRNARKGQASGSGGAGGVGASSRLGRGRLGARGRHGQGRDPRRDARGHPVPCRLLQPGGARRRSSLDPRPLQADR